MSLPITFYPLRKIIGEEHLSHHWYDVLECGHRVPMDFSSRSSTQIEHKRRRCIDCLPVRTLHVWAVYETPTSRVCTKCALIHVADPILGGRLIVDGQIVPDNLFKQTLEECKRKS